MAKASMLVGCNLTWFAKAETKQGRLQAIVKKKL